MKLTTIFRQKFKKLSQEQQGVFTSNDLWIIISPTSKVDFYRQIKKMEKEKLLSRICREIYVSENFSSSQLIMTLKPQAYLSLEYSLAYYNLIGSYSENKIRPILPYVNKSIKSDLINIEFKKINPGLIFGIDCINGVRIANKEKAFLDTLYFHQKGSKFLFDIYSDILIDDLDIIKIQQYLQKYKNPKFIKFVMDYLNV